MAGKNLEPWGGACIGTEGTGAEECGLPEHDVRHLAHFDGAQLIRATQLNCRHLAQSAYVARFAAAAAEEGGEGVTLVVLD